MGQTGEQESKQPETTTKQHFFVPTKDATPSLHPTCRSVHQLLRARAPELMTSSSRGMTGQPKHARSAGPVGGERHALSLIIGSLPPHTSHLVLTKSSPAWNLSPSIWSGPSQSAIWEMGTTRMWVERFCWCWQPQVSFISFRKIVLAVLKDTAGINSTIVSAKVLIVVVIIITCITGLLWLPQRVDGCL